MEFEFLFRWFVLFVAVTVIFSVIIGLCMISWSALNSHNPILIFVWVMVAFSFVLTIMSEEDRRF